MELLYALPALILALVGLIGLRKENNNHLYSIRYYIKRNKFITNGNEVLDNELKEEKKSNASNQGWNTKYRKTIEELEERIEAMILDREGSVEKNQDQADTIKRMSSQFDEVHVLLETLLVTPKKKQAELVNKFIFETK